MCQLTDCVEILHTGRINSSVSPRRYASWLALSSLLFSARVQYSGVLILPKTDSLPCSGHEIVVSVVRRLIVSMWNVCDILMASALPMNSSVVGFFRSRANHEYGSAGSGSMSRKMLSRTEAADSTRGPMKANNCLMLSRNATEHCQRRPSVTVGNTYSSTA